MNARKNTLLTLVVGLIVFLMMIVPASGSNADEAQEVTEDPPTPELWQWQGYIGCSYWVWPGTAATGCPPALQDPNDDRLHGFQADAGLKTLVVAIEWDPEGMSTTSKLRHVLFVGNETHGVDLVRENRGSPIEYRVDHIAGSSFNDFSGDTMFRFTMGAGGSGATESPSLVMQQPFTVNYHLFYDEHAPKGYSAFQPEPPTKE
jgi:hypothetical protein